MRQSAGELYHPFADTLSLGKKHSGTKFAGGSLSADVFLQSAKGMIKFPRRQVPDKIWVKSMSFYLGKRGGNRKDSS